MYGVLGVAMVLVAALDCFTYTWVTLNAASRLHNTLFKKVTGLQVACPPRTRRLAHDPPPTQILSMPMSFFDTTPSGRIVNRFSKDQEEADTVLPLFMDTFLQYALMVLFIVAIISAVFPYMLLAVLLLGAIFLAVLL